MDDVTGREVLARVLVQRLVELPDQLLEDRPHRGVIDHVGLQVQVLELALVFRLRLEHFDFRRRKDAVEPAQYREWQDHVLILASFEGVADEVGDTPEEAHDLAMVQGPIPSPLIGVYKIRRTRNLRDKLLSSRANAPAQSCTTTGS